MYACMKSPRQIYKKLQAAWRGGGDVLFTECEREIIFFLTLNDSVTFKRILEHFPSIHKMGLDLEMIHSICDAVDTLEARKFLMSIDDSQGNILWTLCTTVAAAN